jgi:hypothetical protein
LCRAAALVHAQVLFHRNTTFAPAKFVIEATAVCALEETAPGVAPRFDLRQFHAAAYERAAARGFEFRAMKRK